jgi:hypothetical protein
MRKNGDTWGLLTIYIVKTNIYIVNLHISYQIFAKTPPNAPDLAVCDQRTAPEPGADVLKRHVPNLEIFISNFMKFHSKFWKKKKMKKRGC